MAPLCLGLAKGGRLEDIANLHWLGMGGDRTAGLSRGEAAAGRLGKAVELQAEAAARSR